MQRPETPSLLADCARAAEARPDDADAQMVHGNALAESGEPHAAIVAYRAALRLRPGHAPALYNLGNALLATGDAGAALQAYDAALALAPDNAGCLNNRGNALRRLGRPEHAADSYRATLALRPDLPGAHNNLASALLALHQPEAALESLHSALRLHPEYAEACDNMGGALLALDRPEEALGWFDRAATLDPRMVQSRFGAALALLALGRLREGFAAYEWRWQDPRFCEDTRFYPAALWLGEGELRGRTVVLHAEQGLGDTLHFVRYAPLLRARGARVILEVQAPLIRLLRPLADAVIPAGGPLPDHDLHTPLLSLPHAFGTDLDTIPADVPYITAPKPRTDVRGSGLNVAVTLSGSPDHPDDALRSVGANVLAPMFAIAGATFHVLQSDPRPADLEWLRAHPAIRLHRPDPTDFTDAAALIAAMDLVVSVDTAIAHLAGALAAPAWVLLQHAADFRWLRERSDSPWYPTARLFRQGPDRRWEPVVQQVVEALQRRCGG